MTMHNVEAEQAILGAILLNNDAFQRVSGIIRAEDFGDAVHGAIFAVIAAKIGRDELASPVTLKTHFDAHEGLAALGGVAYLARLAGAAVSLFAAKDLALVIAAAARKRRLAAVLEDARAKLDDPDQDCASALGAVEAHTLTEDSRDSADIISFQQAVHDAAQEERNARTGEGPQPMPTGVARLDDMLGGFYPGDFVILAGRPGMGKSAVALSFALNAARAGKGVALASLEMSASSLAMRAISEATDRAGRGLAYADARKGRLADDDAQDFIRAAIDIQHLPIKIIPPTCRDLGSLYAAARRCQMQFEAKGQPMAALVVDYLQLIRSSRQNRYEEITEISIALKQMALQLKVPVIALSQLSRAVESRDDKRPIMSDLRESGQLEQDADVILFCYRDEYYLRRETPEAEDLEAYLEHQAALARAAGWLDIIVAKQRMGEIGAARVRFEERFNSLRGGIA